jgi:hypothetical protein
LKTHFDIPGNRFYFYFKSGFDKNHDPDDHTHTHLEEIANDELNPVLDAVDVGVLPGQLDLVWVDVDGNDSLAGEGELDGVAAHAAEAVDYQVTPTPSKRIKG